ncbi:MAG: ComEC/Rec2 family competence protein, partial [Pseudomonadota bacterium]
MAGDYPEDGRNASQIKPADLPRAKEGLVVRTSYNVPAPSAMRALGFRFSDTFQTVLGHLRSDALAEAESGSLFNMVPVFIAMGCVLYFLAPAEPLLATLFIPLPLWFVLAKARRRGFAYNLLFAATLVFTGMSAAKISTLNTGTPIIERQLTAVLTGTILAVDENRRGAPRYIIKPHSIEGMPDETLPRLLRLSSASRQTVFLVGDSLSGLARIQPVSGPVYPGGYDFSFFAHFDELGGSGFFMGTPKPAPGTGTDLLDWHERLLVAINQMRSRIAERIRIVLPGMSGDVAVALVIGDKSGIPEEVQESLRATGLAHILAISGLHMALVTLTVIWVVRLLCALSPDFATRHPVKKIAALTGFIFATTYLAMSGWGVATQRAWVMISVMLCAVLLDRRAITMRSVAISAIMIVMLKPESLFSPGFQMSFSAVASLVAAYEALNRWSYKRREATNRDIQRTGLRGLARNTGTYFGSLAMTSLVAGSATSFIAAMHFHQVPALGLMANVIAMPVVSMLVMPFVLLSLILMPFGFEFLALYPVHHGVRMRDSSTNGITSIETTGMAMTFA